VGTKKNFKSSKKLTKFLQIKKNEIFMTNTARKDLKKEEAVLMAWMIFLVKCLVWVEDNKKADLKK